MTLEQDLKSVGKKTFVKCFAEAHRCNGDIATERVAECDIDSAEWEDDSLATKASKIRKIFRDGNQCKALQMCFTISHNPAAEQEAKKLFFIHCKERGIAMDDKLNEKFMDAVRIGDCDVVQRLLAEGADPNADDCGETALHFAEDAKNRELIRILKEAGAEK